MYKILIAGEASQTLNYVNACISCNTIPVVSLSLHDMAECDGLILPGGGDIEPSLFGQKPNGAKDIDEALDRFQIRACEYFISQKKPILGICKGIQIINVTLGGDIIQDLPAAKAHTLGKTNGLHHNHAVSCSFIDLLYGPSFYTNSTHHQAVGRLGKHLNVAQYADDGCIEALYHDFLPLIATQWHPERMGFSHKRPDGVNGELIFSFFLDLFRI